MDGLLQRLLLWSGRQVYGPGKGRQVRAPDSFSLWRPLVRLPTNQLLGCCVMQTVFSPQCRQGVFVCDASALEWQPAGKPGIVLRPVRYDGARGEFLGMVGFDPLVRSGTHQHQGVASSYFVDGALTDHQGSAVAGEVGINLKGATHDAIAYRKSLLVSRLEGPVLYLPEEDHLSLVHAGARHEGFETLNVDAPTDLNIRLDGQALVETGAAGVRRRLVFDYAGCADNHRLIEWQLRARSALPAWKTTQRVELWIHGGGLLLNGQPMWGNCFAIIEPDTEVLIESRFGARVLVWADGPVARDRQAGFLAGDAGHSADWLGFPLSQ